MSLNDDFGQHARVGEHAMPATTDAASTAALSSDEAEAILALKNLEARRRKRKRGRIIRGIVLVAIIAAGVGIWAALNAPAGDESQEAVPNVVPVMRDDLVESINATGTIKPVSIVAVSPEVSGIIEAVMVEEGQTVEKGDTLLTIRSKDVEKALKDAQRGVEKAQHGVDKAFSEVDDAEQSREEARSKYDDAMDAYIESADAAAVAAQAAYNEAYSQALGAIPKGATPEERKALEAEALETAWAAFDSTLAEMKSALPEDFDEADFNKAIKEADSAIWDAEQTLAEAQDAYNEAEEEAGHRRVTAPASGVVLALSAVEGASVGGAAGGTSAASSEALAQIADVSSLKVNIEVNEIDVANVAEGQNAKVTFSSFPDIEQRAKVTSVASIATGAVSGDANGSSGGGGGVVTFSVEAVIEDPDKRLKPGMSANVEILTKEVPGVIVVPVAAIVYEGDGTYIDVVAGEDEQSLANPERRKVTLGETTKSHVEVKEGLAEGELVIAGTTTPSALDDSDAAMALL